MEYCTVLLLAGHTLLVTMSKMLHISDLFPDMTPVTAT